MITFGKILVPLDGSPLAEQALDYARELMKLSQGRLFLVCVVSLISASLVTSQSTMEDTMVAPRMLEEKLEAERDEAQAYLERTANRLRQVGTTMEAEVWEGNPGQEIVEAVKGHNVDVVVISTHGRIGLGRAVFGSVADHVVRHSGVPTLLVHPKA